MEQKNTAVAFLLNLKDLRAEIDNDELMRSILSLSGNLATSYLVEHNLNKCMASLLLQSGQIIDELSDNDPNLINFVAVADALALTTNRMITNSIQNNLLLNSTENMLEAHVQFVKNERLFQKLTSKEVSSHGISLIDTIMANMNWLSRYCADYKQKWTDLEVLKYSLKAVLVVKLIGPPTYQMVSNIADDKQIETLEDIHTCLKALIDVLKKCSHSLANSGSIYKDKMEVMEEEKIVSKECYYINDENGFQSFYGILLALYKLSINDHIRKEMYFKFEIKKDLKILLDKGAELDRSISFKLLCQLSFNHEIASDIATDKALMDLIKRIQNSHDKLESISKQINWNINKLVSGQNSEDESKQAPKHVMISYNTGSRELCLKMKASLEEAGFRVWMDVSDIHGSSLESMASAVEGSFCVLMCVTERYRQSINCQSEAQYAYKLSKPIVPCIMQAGYENVNGWLGIIMGDKIFINFMKYEYEECIRRLKAELDQYIGKTVKVEEPVKPQSVSVTVVRSQATVQVDNGPNVNEVFANDESLKVILSSLGSCDEHLLRQIYDMKTRAPEFYYQMLRDMITKKDVDFRPILEFSAKLDSVFGKK